ncbi:hypothetical protein MIND_00376300 [Mycena indigotica]|uniref:Uncharacterized protein n=1 Tax=Mycena indigotica TaxID=2126181 RepID=A0A8H6T1P6_9AGAR|nr:uncharacterized protein MIND_00376300 [Mycena indigotica]KAF7310033.1 hypothetical protein MIND_00376300 [Mycena indigotica]
MLFLLALSSSSFEARAVSQCTDINDCRRLFDIVWGCIVTIFACVWVSVHPNVPPPGPVRPKRNARLWSWLKWYLLDIGGPFKRRLKLMVAALVAPEVIVGFAVRQLWMARFFAQGTSIDCFPTCHKLSSAYFSVRRFAHTWLFHRHGWITPDADILAAIQAVPESTLADKSKGDMFSKGIALCQGLWFVAQCIARGNQHLPLSELEIATLAFAIINAFTWLLWWGKPLDVRDPVIIDPRRRHRQAASARPPKPKISRLNRLGMMLIGVYEESEFAPTSAGTTAVPTFWCTARADIPERYQRICMASEFFCAAVFGAIHFIAWSNAFPTTGEKWLWRVSTLVITVLPVILLVVSFLDATLSVVEHVPHWYGIVFMAIGGVLYPAGRLVLLVLPFTTLRTLPLKTFMDVAWSVYFPHL